MKRLKYDADTPEDLRAALDLESEAVDGYDLVGLRQKIVGPPKPPPSLPWRTFTAVIAVSGFTAALVTWSLQAPVPARIVPIEPARIEAVETQVHVQPGRSIAAEPDGSADAVDRVPSTLHDAVRVAVPVAAPGLQAEQAEPSNTPVELEDPSVQEPAVVPPADPTVSSDEPEVQPPASGLAAELAVYNRGLDASDRSQWSDARDAYTDYLTAWPQGRLRTEAQLGLLTATVNGGSAAAAEVLAAEMLAQGSLGNRRKDVQLLQAEALVELGRCDDAVGIIGDFRRSPRVNSIRQACKRRRD